jgi:hypothetical protein
MPSTRYLVTAAAVGALAGALGALWVTVGEAQGLTLAPGQPAAVPGTCEQHAATADNAAPRPTEASKPVVDEGVVRCP